ncbi:MAG: DegQ family serine endoprotease [Nitrospiraceae bacterium]
MRGLLQRRKEILTGLVILGAIAIWHAEWLPSTHASGSAETAQVNLPHSNNQGASGGFADVAEAVTPAIVNITVLREHIRGTQDLRNPMEEFFGSPRRPHMPREPWNEPWDPRRRGMGSGVIVSPDGYIVTNDHVVQGARKVSITLPDKREFEGKVIGRDPKTDLAVIHVEASDLPSLTWGNSSKVRVGEYVLAIGNPFGLDSTVTLGIVSAVGRGQIGITQYEDFIQTDAAINPGNSGGALVNTGGELIGINTAIFSRTGGYQGVGLAVPTSMAKPVFESLVKTGKVVRGYLGLGIQDLSQDLADSFQLKTVQGALVSEVVKGSPAERGGIKRGDVIIEYQDVPINDAVSLQRAVTRTPVGKEATIRVVRNGREEQLKVQVGELGEPTQVASGGQAHDENPLAGVVVRELDRRAAHELGLDESVSGLVIMRVEPESRADRAGLTRGDVIREINRQPVKSVRDYERLIAKLPDDRSALVLISRGGASLFISVKA